MKNMNDTQIREYRQSLIQHFFKAIDLLDDMEYAACQSANKEMEHDIRDAKHHIQSAQFDFLHYEEKVMTNNKKELTEKNTEKSTEKNTEEKQLDSNNEVEM